MKIDIEKFISLYSSTTAIKYTVKSNIINLLHLISEDTNITDIRYVAYMLATTKHETAFTFAPIEEYGKGKGRPYGKPASNGKLYYGRGFVQLTWDKNYKTMGDKIGVDLYNHPELALDFKVAYQIMSTGMRLGLFTGVGLKRYINDKACDFKNARRIINGTDCADKIATYANSFLSILKQCAA